MPCRHVRRRDTDGEPRSPPPSVTGTSPVTLLSQDNDTRFGLGHIDFRAAGLHTYGRFHTGPVRFRPAFEPNSETPGTIFTAAGNTRPENRTPSPISRLSFPDYAAPDGS
ncbi:hypothetical protein GCM10017557_65150 [Streptomyces aurantiacus]|uniref:Uncharacterized protein n=1 Tax=Streptomyces aurantiacus TaxID=47760 RepID=A0A7G1PCY3_9ACTN|nr:hypothetical protein GCM10017557_65150 [Streptomyces aurantiacus]